MPQRNDLAERWPCPCCGYRTLPEIDAYELCPVCFWEDDPTQSRDPKLTEGANGVSLDDGRRAYKKFGAMAPEFATKVRPPSTSEASERQHRSL